MGNMDRREGPFRSGRKLLAPHSTADSGSKFLANIAFIILSHLLFVFIVAFVLLATLPIAHFVHYYTGAIIVAVAALALMIHYPRIGNGIEKVIDSFGVANQVARELPNVYVAGLSICHCIPLFVLLYILDGSFWVYQHPVEYLSAANEVPLSTVEGIYHIEDSKIVASLGYSHSSSTTKGARSAGTTYLGTSTTWKVAPVGSSKDDKEKVEFSIYSGTHCVWLGSNDRKGWITDRLQATDESHYFQERDSRDVQKYFSILEEHVGEIQLPSCTRILERVLSPDALQETYWTSSLLVLGLAHGIPLIFLSVFYCFSSVKQKSSKAF